MKQNVTKTVDILVVADEESISSGNNNNELRKTVKQLLFESLNKGREGGVWSEQQWTHVCNEFNQQQ